MTPDFTIFTALPFETRLARGLGLKRQTAGEAPRVPTFAGTVAGRSVVLFQTGIRAHRLAKLPAASLVRPRHGVISAGLAGGLDPSLPGGAVVTSREVLMEGRRFLTDRRLTGLLADSGAIEVHAVLTVETVLATSQEKQAAGKRMRAQAVDMESAIIAAWAQDQNVPFAVLRGISDPATSSVPPALLAKNVSLRCVASLPGILTVAARALRARRLLCRVLKTAFGSLLQRFTGSG